MSASRSSRSPPRREEIAAEAIEAIKIDFEQLPHVTDPLESLFPGGPNARSNGNVAAAQINLQTVKWDAGDFAAAGDDKMPLGKPAEEWAYGDLDAGFKAAKLVIEESFVSAGYSHHSMETRSAFARWEGGKCILHGSNQSHTSAVPNIARLIGIKPEDLVLVAEFCGGGFGSKIPGYPNMAIAALMSKKINRPVMHRISRMEEYGIGSARPSFQGHVKLGFREDGKLSPPTSTSCRRTARISAAATSAPPAMRSRSSISPMRCAGAPCRCSPTRRRSARSAGPARTSSCRSSSR